MSLDYMLLLRPQAVDLKSHYVPLLEELRRLHAQADAGGSAGNDDIARKQCHELTQIGNDLRDRKNHVLSITLLPDFAVYA